MKKSLEDAFGIPQDVKILIVWKNLIGSINSRKMTLRLKEVDNLNDILEMILD